MNCCVGVSGNKTEVHKGWILKGVSVKQVLLELRNFFALIFQPDTKIENRLEKGFPFRLLTVLFKKLGEFGPAGCRQPALVGFDLLQVMPILVMGIGS